MELLDLFIVFMKIGFTSFGGMSMVPIINEEMLKHGWMNTTDVANIIAMAEMTPGPLGVNCATFAGIQVAGIIGGIIAVIGVLMPAFTTTLIVAIFYERFKDTRFMGNVLYVIRPICIGLMLAIICTMSLTTYLYYVPSFGDRLASFSKLHQELWAALDFKNIIIGLLSLYLLLKQKKGVIFVICTAAVSGLALNMLF